MSSTHQYRPSRPKHKERKRTKTKQEIIIKNNQQRTLGSWCTTDYMNFPDTIEYSILQLGKTLCPHVLTLSSLLLFHRSLENLDILPFNEILEFKRFLVWVNLVDVLRIQWWFDLINHVKINTINSINRNNLWRYLNIAGYLTCMSSMQHLLTKHYIEYLVSSLINTFH